LVRFRCCSKVVREYGLAPALSGKESKIGGKPQMKIMLVHNVYQQKAGEEVVFESEKRLLEQNGHEVTTYVRSNMELQNASLLDRIAAAPRMVWSSKTRREFATKLESERPDVVHIHNTFMVISPSIYSVCSERRVPIVQTLHNFRLLCPAANFFRHGTVCEACVDGSLLSSIQHGCYRNSRGATAGVAAMLAVHRTLDTWRTSVSRFIALTEFAKGKFVASGFSPDRFVVKPNFADCDPGPKTHVGDYAVFVGRLHGPKGVNVLLDAWKKLAAQYPLQIVGDGPERATMEAQARELQLSGIVFRGQLSRAETMNIVKSARFTIVPSIWYEGFPMCIVESFACGTAVVCSKLGALSEIVEDRSTGLHFKAGDPEDLASTVEWAWNHPAEIAEMGRAARSKYETTYTAQRNYGLLMEIYGQALAAEISLRN
jgi:glycosyltransferase involved in cell wall biosynthesis